MFMDIFDYCWGFLPKQETAVGLLGVNQLPLGDTCRCDSLLLKMRNASATCWGPRLGEATVSN